MSWPVPVKPVCVPYYPLHTVLAGAASARPSLRPLTKREQTKLQTPGENASRECFRLFENWNGKFRRRPVQASEASAIRDP